MIPGRRTVAVILVALALVVAVAAYGVFAVDRPQVESVDNEWGTVTSERTEVETTIGIDNPMLLRVGDGAADVSYRVSLNDLTVAEERERRVHLSGRESTVSVSTWVNNDDIPDWWVTHVNRNETTTVRVEPDVIVEVGGVRLPADRWTRTRTIRTDLLAPLEFDERREFERNDRTVFVVNETDAQWGNATENRTPINATATVTNSLSLPVPITGIGYTVELNGIVVGQGTAGRDTVLAPGTTRTIEADAAIDNSKLDEWWVTHLRDNQTSNLTVDFNATVDLFGSEQTLPLDFISYERTFRTDLFGGGGTSGSPPGGTVALDQPRTVGADGAIRSSVQSDVGTGTSRPVDADGAPTNDRDHRRRVGLFQTAGRTSRS